MFNVMISKTAAIYCRLSTDNQEKQGTSLQTEHEAYRKYCQVRRYQVEHQPSEA